MKVDVLIKPKKEILDPQGKAVARSLTSLGFSGIKNIRVGKVVEIEFEASSSEDAKKIIKVMCEKLLVNATVEDFTVNL